MIDPDVEDLPKKVKWKLALLVAGMLAVVGLMIAASIMLLARTDDQTSNPQPSASPSLDESEVLFLEVIRERPVFQDEKDRDLLALGSAVCADLHRHMDWTEVRAALLRAGSTDYDAGYLMRTSAQALCPENLSKLPEVN